MGLIVWSVLNAIITAGRRCCNHLNEKYLGQRIKPWTDYGEESDLSEEFALKRDTALYRMIKSERTLKNIWETEESYSIDSYLLWRRINRKIPTATSDKEGPLWDTTSVKGLSGNRMSHYHDAAVRWHRRSRDPNERKANEGMDNAV